MDHLRRLLTHHVESNVVPGLVAVVWKTGQLDTVVVGDSIGPQSLVRISSFTKPVAAAATLALCDRGRIGIDDPIEKFLPELANHRVLRHVDAPLDDTEPARRPITVRHLLTCTMGFGFPMTPGPHPVMKEQAALGIGLGPPKPGKAHAPDEWIRRLASLPLMAHPGERWMYDTSFSVLGVLLARACGRSFEAVLRDTILGPLGMDDTSFWVTQPKLPRLTQCLQAREAGSSETVLDEGSDASQWAQPPVFEDAAGGLVSTADDYLKFALMLLNQGRHETTRVLSASSVESMTSNYITADHRGPASVLLDSRGWGMGVSVALPPNDDWSRPGRYGWDGGLGTSWLNDPSANLSAILISQRFPPAFELFADFWKGVSES